MTFDIDSCMWALTLEEKISLLSGADSGFTQAVPRLGIPRVLLCDGPHGARVVKDTDPDGTAPYTMMGEMWPSTAFPCEAAMAATWNTELLYQAGEAMGEESQALGVGVLLGPGMDHKRSPLGGRNFEYYSEDPLLSGKIGAACVSGAGSKGVFCAIKHFAANEQETNRVNNGVSSWVNEQALRELYLKPFEYTVKNAAQTIRCITDEAGTVSEVTMAGCTAVMSSYNRVGAVWAGGSVPLMTTVLRDEWGFAGLVITDFDLYGYMNPDQAIAAGSDLILSTEAMKSLEDTSSATAVRNLRKACHSILYTVAHSNAMNGIAPGTIISYTTAPWVTGLIIADVVIGVLLCSGVVLTAAGARRRRQLP